MNKSISPRMLLYLIRLINMKRWEGLKKIEILIQWFEKRLSPGCHLKCILFFALRRW